MEPTCIFKALSGAINLHRYLLIYLCFLNPIVELRFWTILQLPNTESNKGETSIATLRALPTAFYFNIQKAILTVLSSCINL